MSQVDLVWLIDADPPSDVGGGRGFYPASPGGPAPDAALMRGRFTAIAEFVSGEAGGAAVITVHTSPRFRETLLAEPYASIFRDLSTRGAALALHPHEDRADGTSLYDDIDHLAAVIGRAMGCAIEAGLALTAFRSGGFAFHPRLPSLLAEHGIDVDLSAAPGLADAARCAVWPTASGTDPRVTDDAGGSVAEIPLGWDGYGTDLATNYLYNERLDLAGLSRVWGAIVRAAERDGARRMVNFLTHGFGLVEPGFRRQAVAFLRHAEATGGRLVTARDAAQRGLAERAEGHDR